MIRKLILLAAALSLPQARAQQQPPDPEPTRPTPVLTPRTGVPTLHASARAVRIEVVVTDNHGHAIHGLTADNFNVTEDSELQTIQAFEEIHPNPIDLTQTPATLPLNTFTNGNKVKLNGAMTVLLIDGLDTRLEYQAFAHSELTKYLDTAHLEGPVAIFALDTQLRLIQGFTTDVEVLRRAVQLRDKLIQTVYPRTGYVANRFRTEILTHAMSDLGKYLAGFPGRKNLMWFTGSVPTYSYDDGTYLGGALHDSESITADYAKAAQILQLGEVAVYPIDAEGLRTNPAFSASQRSAPSINQISNFSINQAEKHEDLDDVARATGGRAFYNTNGIRQAIAEVVETGSNYYTLLYTPTNRFWDGQFRKLKVTLNSSAQVSSNPRLEYRSGYYALTDVGPAPSTRRANSTRRQLTNHDPDAFAKAMQLGAVDPGTIVFQTHVDAPASVEQLTKGAPAPPENYLEPKYLNKPFRNLRVTYTVPAKQLQISPLPSGILQGSVEFVAVVIDEKGNLVNSEEGTVEMNLKPETYATMLSGSGMRFPLQIAVPVKGNYFLRTGVRDIPSGRAGALELSTTDLQLVP